MFHRKICSKCIIDLKTKHKTVKFLEDIIGESIGDLRHGANDFLDKIPQE